MRRAAARAVVLCGRSECVSTSENSLPSAFSKAVCGVGRATKRFACVLPTVAFSAGRRVSRRRAGTWPECHRGWMWYFCSLISTALRIAANARRDSGGGFGLQQVWSCALNAGAIAWDVALKACAVDVCVAGRLCFLDRLSFELLRCCFGRWVWRWCLPAAGPVVGRAGGVCQVCGHG